MGFPNSLKALALAATLAGGCSKPAAASVYVGEVRDQTDRALASSEVSSVAPPDAREQKKKPIELTPLAKEAGFSFDENFRSLTYGRDQSKQTIDFNAVGNEGVNVGSVVEMEEKPTQNGFELILRTSGVDGAKGWVFVFLYHQKIDGSKTETSISHVAMEGGDEEACRAKMKEKALEREGK